MIDSKPVIEVIDSDMAEIFRSKTPAERLEVAFRMWRSTRDMLIAMLASQHPTWPEDRIAAEAAVRLSHGSR